VGGWDTVRAAACQAVEVAGSWELGAGAGRVVVDKHTQGGEGGGAGAGYSIGRCRGVHVFKGWGGAGAWSFA
jgi:hypothetical protein